MLQVNQIRAGAALSYVSMALSTVISLVYTPIMLRQLGDSEFGVYQAVLPIISYLNLLSFGLGSAYVRYYSRFRAAGDKKGCAKLNGMFLITYLILGALVLAIGFGLSYCDVVFGKKLTAEEIDLAQRLLRIMSVNAALTFPISVFESHVTINERYLFQKIVAMGKQVLNPLIMIPLLLIGYRSVTLTIVSLIFTVLSGVINITYCLTRLKMPFAFRHYDFALLREMFGFTLYVFIGIVVDNINWSIDRQLLTWFHGSAAVTVYVIASQLNNYFLLFGNAISNVMTPRVHRLVAENAPMRTLDALFTKVGRLQFILLGGIFLGFVAIGQSFVVLWGGGEQFRIDYWTALLLFFACLWTNIQTVGIEIQRAKNMHKYRSLVYLGVLVGNIVISIPLCMKWQGLGAAIGTAVATLVGNVFLMNRYYYKHIGLNIPGFWRHISHLLPAMVLPTTVAVLLAVFAAVYFISRGNYHKNVQQQLYQALEQGDYGRSQPGMDSIPCFVAEVYGSGTVRVAGNSYYDLSDETRMAEIVTAALAADEDAGTLDEFHLRYLRQRGYTTTAIAFTDTYLEYTSLHTLLKACSLVGCGALVVLFLCSYLLSGVVTKPVGAAWAQQEQFLSDASHELKTPLTVILSSAELLEQSASPEQAVYVDNIRAEGRRMKALVEDMLTLFRAQKNAGSPPDTVTDLSEAAVTAALRFEPVAFEAGHVLDYDIAPSLPVRGDGAKLGQALAVLLDNAVKYAAPGTPIRLTAVRQGSRAVVSVTDQGPDIPSDKLPRIFDRFYRADDARTDGDSFGLGLPIAKAIVDAHRGVLRCDSSGGVTTFSISLPLTAGKQERGTDHV